MRSYFLDNYVVTINEVDINSPINYVVIIKGYTLQNFQLIFPIALYGNYDRRGRGEGGRKQREQALPLCRGAERNMGIKPRPSRTLELGRSTSSIPASPLPLSPCPPASGSDDIFS